MGIQPSASRTALLLRCPRPFDPALEADPDLPGEPARYGSAFHQVLAACLRTPVKKPLERSARYELEVNRAAVAYDVKGAREELAGHVKGSAKVLRNWLEREKLEVAEIEGAHAVKPEGSKWASRPIAPHDEDHRYDVEAGELPGTTDVIARSANRTRTVVLDHKTGSGDEEKYAQPAMLPQMRTLGLVAIEQATPNVELAIFHADRRGLPIVYAEPYEKGAQRSHSEQLSTALGWVGQGFLRHGLHCARCPARITCPAHAADLISEGTAALVSSANSLASEPIDPKKFGILADPENGMTVEDRASALYDLLKKFRALEKAGSEEIKRLVKSGAVVETREGKVLTLQTQTYETLSKKSVLEALGKVAGEKMLTTLRSKGAIRETTREVLQGEK